MATVIGIGHYARTGKDALAEILVREHGFTRIAFADALRNVLYESDPLVRRLVDAIGWESAKITHSVVRNRLVAHGNAIRKHLGEDAWIRAVERQIHEGRYVIPDVRYSNEVEWILSIGTAVKLTRPGVEPLPNIADQTLVGFTGWTREIHNSGTLDDLARHAADLMEDL